MAKEEIKDDLTAADPPLRLGISSCLMGHEVRFDGGHKRNSFLMQNLGEHVDWFPLCPEVEIGLGTPRESIRLEGTAEETRLVAPRSGRDLTETMRSWAQSQMPTIGQWALHGFVLKKGSPSCGLFRVRVYDNNGMPSHDGRGLFAQELTRKFPLLPAEEEGRLHDPRLRENFIDRIFCFRRWTELLAEGPGPGDLVRFHTAHKLTVLSHSPDHYQKLGRLVAGSGGLPWLETLSSYGRFLSESLRVHATPGRHANVMHHLMGFLKSALDGEDKKELLEEIERHRKGQVPLIVPLTLLNHHLRRQQVPDWVYSQVYLNPYPRELMLRNHI